MVRITTDAGPTSGFKLMKITGTSPAAEGGTVTLATGLLPNKILSVAVHIESSTNFWVPVQYEISVENSFHYHLDTNGDVIITNSATTSGNLLSKNIKAFIVFET